MGQPKEERTVEIIVNGQKANASIKEMDAAVAVLNAQWRKMSQDDPGRAKIIADLNAMKERTSALKSEVGGVSQTAGVMKQALTNAFAFAVGGGIEAAIGKVFELGKSIFDTSAKFETYSAVMTNALGDSSVAQKALADIQNMAANTPFSVDELTGSFIKFVNRGLTPSMAEMTKMADIAASQGKSFDELTEAVLDAGTGEFERLKEFGIQASKSGDEVSLSFKGVTKTVANTPEAIQATILAFGEMKGIMGSTAAISATMEGQLSNLGDTADQVAIEFGKSLRPAFVAILSTIGFFLGVLKELPGFVKENRGALLALAGAVLTFNAPMIQANYELVKNAVLSKGKVVWDGAVAASTRIWTVAQEGLNLALTANPIGAVIAVGTLLVGLFIMLYDKSEKFRAGVAGLGAGFMAFVTTIKDGVIQNLTGLGDLLGGIIDGSPARMKKGLEEIAGSVKTIYYDSGKNAAAAYGQGYDEKMAADQPKRVGATMEMMAQLQTKLLKAAEEASKKRIAAEAAARAVALKNEEADLKERLAKVKADSEQEMRIKQQLVTNNAQQELLDVKKSDADRRIILAEADKKRLDLAQSFYEKRATARKAAMKKAAEEAEKQRKADEAAARSEQERLLNLQETALVARGNKREIEYGKILIDAQRKALAVTGTEAEKNAAIELLMAEAHQKQTELRARFAKEDLDNTHKEMDEDLAFIEASEVEREAAFQQSFDNALISERGYHESVYAARLAAGETKLALIEGLFGKESAAYRKAYKEQQKTQADANAANLADDKKTQKAKWDIAQLSMKTAGDVVQTTIDLLFQDEAARKQHHNVYTALSGAKIIMDGVQEVASIWRYAAENPANGLTGGVAGAVIGGVQTALAVARTVYGLTRLQEFSFAQGGRTGSGLNFGGGKDSGVTAVSPMGTLMEMAGMAIAPNGRLVDNSGFAVAGIVHEDEYVVPKWMRQDPQVAAVEQWLEARRLRGYAEGGATGGGVTLPAASAAPQSDGELTYAVLVQILEQARIQSERLAGVESWQTKLSVHLNLVELDKGQSELKQVQLENGIR